MDLFAQEAALVGGKVGIPELPPIRSWSLPDVKNPVKGQYISAKISLQGEDGTVVSVLFSELDPGDQDAVLKFLRREIDRAKAIEWLGTITEVTDGDTVIFHDADKNRHIVRLNDIDAPEISQEFGLASKKHLEKLVLGKTVKLRWFERDRYDRILGDILVGGEDNKYKNSVNAAVAIEGLAWWYEAYSDSAVIRECENKAKAARRGIWAMKNPVPPWQFRRNSALKIFYVAKNGNEYHTPECEKVKPDSIPISDALVELNEYVPCPDCH